MEAEAEHDFNATANDELSFRKGDILKILNCDEDPHWYKAELNGNDGFVPSNYLKFRDHKWYLGKISRKDAEAQLAKPNIPDGTFLVRQSETSFGEFSISVRCKESSNGTQHFKVLRDGTGKYYIWEQKFNSINELLNHHRAVSISRTETILLKDMVSDTILVKALFDFDHQEEGELSFKRGDIITILEKEDDNWWRGQLNDQTGLFPSTYVCPV